jgi:hypothetical protein
MGRARDKLRKNYVVPMVNDGRLIRLYPDVPGHPKQGYKTADT